ncbi:ATP synthase subunit epsilon [Nocardioides sp. Root1257]|uniref:F0F1 ATP synthase subunit epsilon n=1 Tax=unclassified Nocardioides TaxID=2615069 RepID=UPI0006FCA0BB|nr:MULTISPECIES: F0F1 ATP synthase subunit epsilon [unclassified Nocardioides]KQW48354.1 ATP synthase subunit epsilon [Nocardioides sp. Root1257]KRC47528.1 ATP synthase subunit epsilon [Nocardioides sp. Root224]
MADDQLQVELVAADRTVWSGQATMVVAKTAEGDIGVLRNHMPVLSLLVDGVVEIEPVDGERMFAAVDGGFLSVANNRVSILSQFAALAHEIDVAAARAELESAQSEGEDGEERARRAEVRILAAEKAS